MNLARLLLVAPLLSTSAAAPEGAEGPLQDRRARILARFDADADGQLSEDERSVAREALRERLEQLGQQADGMRGRMHVRRETMRDRLRSRRATPQADGGDGGEQSDRMLARPRLRGRLMRALARERVIAKLREQSGSARKVQAGHCPHCCTH